MVFEAQAAQSEQGFWRSGGPIAPIRIIADSVLHPRHVGVDAGKGGRLGLQCLYTLIFKIILTECGRLQHPRYPKLDPCFKTHIIRFTLKTNIFNRSDFSL